MILENKPTIPRNNDYVVQPNRVVELSEVEAAAFEQFLAEESKKGPTPELVELFAQRKLNQAKSRYNK